MYNGEFHTTGCSAFKHSVAQDLSLQSRLVGLTVLHPFHFLFCLISSSLCAVPKAYYASPEFIGRFIGTGLFRSSWKCSCHLFLGYSRFIFLPSFFTGHSSFLHLPDSFLVIWYRSFMLPLSAASSTSVAKLSVCFCLFAIHLAPWLFGSLCGCYLQLFSFLFSHGLLVMLLVRSMPYLISFGPHYFLKHWWWHLLNFYPFVT